MQSVPGMPPMRPADDRRIPGWRVVREYLADRDDGKPGLLISRRCRELIRCLPALQRDKIRPTDTANEPHDITHAPDALRAFAITYRGESRKQVTDTQGVIWTQDMLEDFRHAGEAGRRYLIKKYGEPKEI